MTTEKTVTASTARSTGTSLSSAKETKVSKFPENFKDFFAVVNEIRDQDRRMKKTATAVGRRRYSMRQVQQQQQQQGSLTTTTTTKKTSFSDGSVSSAKVRPFNTIPTRDNAKNALISVQTRQRSSSLVTSCAVRDPDDYYYEYGDNEYNSEPQNDRDSLELPKRFLKPVVPIGYSVAAASIAVSAADAGFCDKTAGTGRRPLTFRKCSMPVRPTLSEIRKLKLERIKKRLSASLVVDDNNNDTDSDTNNNEANDVRNHDDDTIDDDETDRNIEYYRLRSFSTTAHGDFANLGDFVKSRRSKSIGSVTATDSGIGRSTTTNVTTQMTAAAAVAAAASMMTASTMNFITKFDRGRRHHQSATLTKMELNCSNNTSSMVTVASGSNLNVPSYKVGILGASGVGKTSLTYQFTTSEYICTYDTSLDDDFCQKTISIMLNGQETDLDIIDLPGNEISVESFCASYNVDIFVVVYNIADSKSFKIAEDIILYLWKQEYMTSRAVILVGNKIDLERKREIPTTIGRKLANSVGCKFIETSSGLDHNVDKLLVGIMTQIKLNSKRAKNYNSNLLLNEKRRRQSSSNNTSSGCEGVGAVTSSSGHTLLINRHLLKQIFGFKRKAFSCENLFVL